MNVIRFYILLALFFLPALLSAHYSKTNRNKKISIQLQWKHQFQFAGFYMAKEKGFYAKEGLDVSIKEGRDEINVAQEIEYGKSQYGVVWPSCLIDIAKGKNLIILAALYQSSPLIVLADKSSGIDSIEKFKNKKIMIMQNHFTDPSLIAMLNSNGIQFKDMNIVGHSFSPHELLNKKADLMTSYLSNEPYTLKQLKGKPIIFSPKDYGFNFYGDLLITQGEYLKNNEEEVRKFTLATLKGFEYAFQNKEEAVELIFTKYNSLKKTKKALMNEALELEKLVYDKDGKIGHVSAKKLEKIYDIYKLFGLVKHSMPMKDVEYNKLFTGIQLSQREKKFLTSKKEILVCIDPNSMPFEENDTGKYIGLSADYIDILRNLLSIDFKLVQTDSLAQSLEFIKKRKCDILPLSKQSKKNDLKLNFTSSYYSFPVVVATKADIAFIESVKDLDGKKVAVVKGRFLDEALHNEYNDIYIKEVKNAEHGLRKVDNGEVFAFVDFLPVLSYAIQSNQYDSLKISGKIFDKIGLGIAIRNDSKELFDIMQKAINNITFEQKQRVLNSWISIKYETGANYNFMMKIILAMIVVLGVIGYWNRKISQTNFLLKKSQEEIKAKNRELEEIATTDKLTTLFNRLKIDEILQNEINRSQRYERSFGICLLDIDFFKKINDTYGHQIGDEVLIKVASLLKKMLRKTDYIGRWGGEEFLIISPETEKDEMVQMIEKVRTEMKKESIVKVGTITASFGITKYIQHDTIKSMVQRADIALYTAKNSGRDKIIVN